MESQAFQQPQEKEARSIRAAAIGLVLAILAVYLASLTAPFIYDDRAWITSNPSIQHLSSLGKVLFPPLGSVVRGRPFLSLSFALNYAISGANPWSYHLANLALHCVATLLLFGIARRTLAYLPDRFPRTADRVLPAFGAALLWAVHPIQTESVTYVSQRAESLMGLLYLLTLYSFIRGVQSKGERTWHTAAVAACLLGMATKEVMVSAPLLVLAYDRTFVSGTFSAALRRRRALYAGLGLSWVFLGVLAVGLKGRGAGLGLGYSWWAYGLAEAWAVGHYLLLCAWPFPLVLDRGTDLVASVRDTLPWVCVLAILAGAGLVAFLRRSAVGFAAAAFLLILAPTSSIFPVAFQPMAEHRMYLPLAAVTASVAVGAWVWVGRRSLVPVLLAGLLLGTAAFLRNRDYRDEVTIWSDTVSRVPSNERARLALGSALLAARRDPEAVEQFREALRIVPGDSDARLSLGLSLLHMGRAQEALEQFEAIAPSTRDSAQLAPLQGHGP